jgi:hypothetical protein
LYDVAAQVAALYSVPVYRSPEPDVIASWRELGERLFAQSAADLQAAIERARPLLRTRVGPRRRRIGGVMMRTASAETTAAILGRPAVYFVSPLSAASPSAAELIERHAEMERERRNRPPVEAVYVRPGDPRTRHRSRARRAGTAGPPVAAADPLDPTLDPALGAPSLR